MAGLGLGQLIIGQLPDAVGRRRPLLLGLGWHAVMSVLCALAPTITVPAATCTLQGVAGAAVRCHGHHARDVQRNRAAQLLSRLFLVLRIAPILLPLLGGALHGTAVRLALIIIAAAGLAGILLVIARKALRMV